MSIDDGSFSIRPGPITIAPTRRELRIGVIVAVWALYVTSCYAQVIHPLASGGGKFSSSDCTGFDALLLGWAVAPIGWSANVFLFLGSLFLLFNRVKTAAVLGVMAAFASGSTWFVIDRQYLLGGSYIWLASHVTFAVSTVLLSYRIIVKSHQKPRPTSADME
jgi:hypothetical protein